MPQMYKMWMYGTYELLGSFAFNNKIYEISFVLWHKCIYRLRRNVKGWPNQQKGFEIFIRNVRIGLWIVCCSEGLAKGKGREKEREVREGEVYSQKEGQLARQIQNKTKYVFVK